MASEPIRQSFTCAHCGGIAAFDGSLANVWATEESARVAGWRIGVNSAGVKVCYCPVCAGTDPEYWSDRTLEMAHQAGIRAGQS